MCEPNHHTIRQNSFVVKRVSVYTNQYKKNPNIWRRNAVLLLCVIPKTSDANVMVLRMNLTNMSYEMFEISKV